MVLIEKIKVFESIDLMEPKCPKCGTIIKYGLTTTYDDQKEAHVCNICSTVLE